MPSRAYDGKVSIIQNTKGTIVVEPDPAGDWSNDNVVECLAKMLSFGKKLDAEVKVFYGKGRKSGSLKTDKAEILQYIIKGKDGEPDRYGAPYMSLLPPKNGKSSAVRKIKLA
jgi:hypothetical protein